MRTTYNISFYCRPSKRDKQGQSPIELSINLNGTRKFINCPLKCSPTDFNKKRKPQYIQNYIDNQRIKVATYLVDLATTNTPITAHTLREFIRTGGTQSYTIEKLFDNYNQILQKRIDVNLSLAVYNKYQLVRKTFLKYMGENREITSITPSDIQGFYIDLQNKYKPSTSGGMMTKLKTVFKYALDNYKIKINLFQNIRINKGTTDITTITTSQLNEIIKHTFHPRIQKVADLFIFAAGSGLSYTDCIHLQKEDLQYINNNLCIFKHRIKTNTKYYSVLLPHAVRIVEKYNYDLTPLQISNQKVNAYLKEIQNICDIPISLHFHLARHYYAMYLLNKKVPITTVSKALGHTNLQMTSHYAKALESTIVDDISKIT